VLRSLEELLGYKLWARDGHMGEVEDFFFNEEDWKIRYMVVDTGPWIFGREVLISLEALGQPVWASRTFPVQLTRAQVETSPSADLAKPVSREYEERIHEHYRWPAYWRMNVALPGYPTHIPPEAFARQEEAEKANREDEKRNPPAQRKRTARLSSQGSRRPGWQGDGFHRRGRRLAAALSM
jgi:hypothetical protein